MSREIGVRGAEILPAAATVKARARVRRRRRRGRGGEAAIAADSSRCFRSPGTVGRGGSSAASSGLSLSLWRWMGLSVVGLWPCGLSNRWSREVTGLRIGSHLGEFHHPIPFNGPCIDSPFTLFV